MKADYYSDLALGYIQGSLTPQEKQEVFQLIMEAPDFCEILLLELELSRTLTECKTAPPKKNSSQCLFPGISIRSGTAIRQIGRILPHPNF